MLEFSPAVRSSSVEREQRGSRLPWSVRPLTTLCGGHSYGYGRPVADPRRAPRATARKRPTGEARRV